MEISAKRAFIISDTHFGSRSNSTEWLETMMDWFYSDFIPKVKSEYKDGDILIHCGDVFDNRQSINLSVLHEAIKLFETLSHIFKDGIFIIAGNHDVMKKTSNDISSLDCLKYIPRVHIIKEPIIAKIENKKALFMPWRTNEEEEKSCLASNRIEELNYLFCHTNIRHLKFDKAREVEEGLSVKDLSEFNRVYSGHIHWHQLRKNITMIGNPYQMTRSDSGNEKGWYILNFETGKDKFIENEYSPKFIKIYLNKYLDKTVEEIKEICKNNRVDLYVPSIYLIKYQINELIDSLSKVVKKLEIIPFEDDLEYEGNIDENSTTFNIYELCEKYVKGTNLESKLKDKIIQKINYLYTNTIKDIKD